MTEYLPVIWGGIIALGVILYVVLDGFSLGIGILFGWIHQHRMRDIMMTTVVPVWDGNETWLVLNGAVLFGAFPIAFAILLPALYVPILMMLTALIFRGVAFEFRFKATKTRAFWDLSFFGGSLFAAFFQGVILGAVVRGITVSGEVYAGGPYDWLTPFTVMTGVAVPVGYALLGAGWLILKTVGELQAQMYRAAQVLLLLMMGFIAVVSMWTPFTEPAIAERWFSWPNVLYLAPVPIISAVVAVAALVALRQRRELAPFVLSIMLFILAYAGLTISIWPYIVPRAITLWEGASSPTTQLFLLVGVLIILPVILGYTLYSYRVFRGKVTSAEHYH